MQAGFFPGVHARAELTSIAGVGGEGGHGNVKGGEGGVGGNFTVEDGKKSPGCTIQ